MNDGNSEHRVGPVLMVGPAASAIVGAIRRLHADVDVQDRGSYIRVSVPQRCVVTRRAIEESLGERFELPADLERVMPSFRGFLRISDEEVIWSRDPS